MPHTLSGSGRTGNPTAGDAVPPPASAKTSATRRVLATAAIILVAQGLLVLLVLRADLTGDQQFAAACVLAALFTVVVVAFACLWMTPRPEPNAGVAGWGPGGTASAREGDPPAPSGRGAGGRPAGRGATTRPEGPRVIRVGHEEFEDPFDIPSRYAGQIDLSYCATIFSIIRERYARLIADAFSDPAVRALLLCDREVVDRARSPEEFDFQRVRQIEADRDRLCFILSREEIIEECPWHPLDEGDAYPTLRVVLGPDDADPRSLRDTGVEVLADFDTGNPRRGPLAFDDAIRQEAAIQPGVFAEGTHLGRRYEYNCLSVMLGAVDDGGTVRSEPAVVRFVSEWRSGPFILANASRRAFVGREIMFRFRLRITMDPVRRQTSVHFLS